MNEEKKDFSKWWLLILGLILVTTVVLTTLGFLGKLTSTVVERKVFEQSYQKQAGDSQKLATWKAQLAQINTRLMSETDDSIVNDLRAQKAMLETQINMGRF